jgi:hypothetical protein
MPWTIAPNPAYAGRTPRPLQPACHDRSPFLTVQCACGYELHLHETQLAGIAATDEIATRCHQCADPLIFPVTQLRGAFTQMRKDGWIA